MSCLEIEVATMTRAVRCILHKRGGQALITRFADIWTEETSAGDRIGKALFELNAKAMHSRYKVFINVPPFKFDDWRELRGDDLVDAYKALQFVKYNCAEDGCTESPFYQAMEELLPIVAALIVEDLDSYKKAPWGER
jgi:hypothetical protein